MRFGLLTFFRDIYCLSLCQFEKKPSKLLFLTLAWHFFRVFRNYEKEYLYFPRIVARFSLRLDQRLDKGGMVVSKVGFFHPPSSLKLILGNCDLLIYYIYFLRHFPLGPILTGNYL